jgi:aldose sugar dehydrogenase
MAQQQPPPDPFASPYAEVCAVCHGVNLEGAAQGTPLAGVDLRHGDTVDQIAKNISDGFPQARMPAFSATMDPVKIRRLAMFISEKRSQLGYTDFKVSAPPTIPEGTIKSEKHSFRIETVVSGLDPLPYSIAPLPDGSILLTEKTRGLTIISPEGKQSELIKGTPKAYDDGFEMPGIQLVFGQGYLLDVAPGASYAKDGWIYLHYTDRCSDCNGLSRQIKRPVSMNAVMRGRIRNGEWVDQESLWKTDIEKYQATPDMAAGGRLAFDGKGHVFFGIGIKGTSEFLGVQDLGMPFGKIHRINEDGSIPKDNPFVATSGALPSIWSYGHRSPQGLEFNRKTRQLWGTEMGQRGGDEVNLLLAGKNYGWPLTSKGLKYDGTPVDYGKDLKIEVDLKTIQQPVVDLTPSPAVSSFAFYEGSAFRKWRGNMIVGSLKATELYRMEVRGDGVTHTETLLKGLGRIRDVDVGRDGAVYLLIEHHSGGKILKLVPAK